MRKFHFVICTLLTWILHCARITFMIQKIKVITDTVWWVAPNSMTSGLGEKTCARIITSGLSPHASPWQRVDILMGDVREGTEQPQIGLCPFFLLGLPASEEASYWSACCHLVGATPGGTGAHSCASIYVWVCLIKSRGKLYCDLKRWHCHFWFLRLCVCVFMCVYECVCTCTHVYVCIHVCVHYAIGGGGERKQLLPEFWVDEIQYVQMAPVIASIMQLKLSYVNMNLFVITSCHWSWLAWN